ncbi:hypothetical protein SEA_QUADZERO_54 [Microbacterium phage QuadZero]|nr:hypothetical protein SEA_QUADZERO_54 [Microbacterium phage QuadZero]
MKTIEDVVKFAKARHRLWEGKGTKSRILTTRKFTNVFRVLDRGSQYLLQLMDLHDDPLDRVALSYFYRQVNRPDTMDDIIEANDGYVPEAAEIFDPKWYDKVVRPVATARPGRFLSGAYMIVVSPNDPRPIVDKMQATFPAAANLLGHVAEVGDLATRVMLLQEVRGIAAFMAMQIATDLGYTRGEPDQENTYILPGPGAKRGAGYLVGKTYASEKEARDIIQAFPVELLPTLPGSNGRPASWMDVQNVFCEFSKYARFLEKPVPPTAPPYRRNGDFETIIPAQFIRP